ncbi:hypothetical protein ANO11243_080040 [Dothideomycetidae sp. 11243]|nr:hypothetical protein ANO11243_080040 [fungal sp. No.11243]
MSSNRMSTASTASNKRWSLPSLQPMMETTGSSAPLDRPAQRQGAPVKGNKANRGSISGTAYGKSDFGVQIQPAQSDRRQSTQDRRQSRRISRISKLSDVSEVESERARSRHMSGLPDEDLPGNRRMSTRRLSVADHLVAEDQRRMSRKMSMASTANAILLGQKMSMMNRTLEWQQRPEDLQKEVNWDEDLKKPSNWIQQKKTLNTVVASVLAFCYTITISLYSAAPQAQVGKLSSSPVLCIIPFSTYALGFAFGPAIAHPFEKAYGRKLVFFGILPIYTLLMIGAAVSKNLIALALIRFASALCIAPGLWLTYTVISEVWIGTCETMAIALYIGSIVLGLFAGPIVGGVVVQYETWHWTEYIPLFLIIVLVFTTVAMSETEREAIMRKDKTSEELAFEHNEKRAARRLNKKSDKPSRLHFKGNFMFKKPIRMLLSAPALSMTSVYLSYTLAIMMTLPMLTFPAFSKYYKFDNLARGLTWTAVAGGAVAAIGIVALLDRYVHQPRVRQWEIEIDGENEKGQVGTVGRAGNSHASWRRGLAVSTRNLGLRNSTTTIDSTLRSDSNASSHSQAASTASGGMSNREKRKSRLQAFSERNINIAIAVTRFLNSQPENSDRKIIVERVMVLLKNTESFTTIASSLAQLGLTFEEALLAKTISDAIFKEKGSSDIALARSKSLHRLTAQAALMGSADDAPSERPSMSGSISGPVPPIAPEAPAVPDIPIGPPPEWRWLPSLAASILFPVGLLMFAWTTRKSLPWIVPCIGLAITGLSACLIICSCIAYMFELYWDQNEAANARAGSTMMTFVLAAIIPLIATPMVNAIGVDIGVTILAAVAALLGAVPWVISYKGAQLRPIPSAPASRSASQAPAQQQLHQAGNRMSMNMA